VPQARSSGSKSSSGQAKRSSASKSTSAKKSTGAKRTTARKATSASTSASRARASASSHSARAAANGAADQRLEAVAQRIRKLNERIIDEGKSAGEATLASYEKALKAIASSIERGPGSSDIEWISSLATTQAKFIRDLTAAWTSAARSVLK